ncbi:MAG: hypothetical protein ABWX98_02135, partial [Lacisediminihabitans sp.]
LEHVPDLKNEDEHEFLDVMLCCVSATLGNWSFLRVSRLLTRIRGVRKAGQMGVDRFVAGFRSNLTFTTTEGVSTLTDAAGDPRLVDTAAVGDRLKPGPPDAGPRRIKRRSTACYELLQRIDS